MRTRLWIRVLGPVIGAVGFVLAVDLIAGLWGYAVGTVFFFGCSLIADWIWRRGASHDEVRQDLEDRVRNNLP
jgi:hypothetical protein